MKKIIVCSLLAAMLAFSTACGETETQNNPEDGTLSAEVTTTAETTVPETTTAPAETEAVKDGGEITDDFMKLMGGQKLYIKISADENDMKISMTVVADATGEKENLYMDADIAGLKLVMLNNENGGYIIDHATKTYYVSDSENAAADIDMNATESYTRTGEGTGTLNGEECEYCQYDVVDSEGETSVYNLYHKDGKVVAVEFENDKSLMMIEDYSAELPEGIFEIPEGYAEKEMTFDMNVSFAE